MSPNPEHNLTPAELDNLNQLEAIAQHGLDGYVEVGDALAEIRDRRLYRDTHHSFESYVSDRWGVDVTAHAGTTPTAEQEPRMALRSKPCETLANACEETLSALGGDDRVNLEIRVAVRDAGAPADEQSWDPWRVAEAIDEELVPTLRWLLTQATGTIGRVAHQLEHRAVDIDDDARAHLRDDVLVLDEELATLKALLLGAIDWDVELDRLLNNELPPFDTDAAAEDDE